jgi:glycosyltransferase involved in cell wall biosynthesis
MKKQKSVLMVVAKYPATFGHTSVINYLCKELNELGYRAAIGAFSFDSDPPFGIEKIKLSKRKLLTTGISYLDFDIIQAHQGRVLYYLCTIKPTKPILFHYHGASNKIQETNFKLVMLIYRNKISKITSVSYAGINQMKRLVKDISAEVIYNGVDTKLFNPDLPTPHKKGTPQLLFVSGLRKYKKTKILIESMPSILEKFPDAHLQIVGEGEDYTVLENIIKEKKLNNRIELIGKIDHDELIFYYSSCDLYISASTFEVCPVPTLEAMACGKPLALSDIEPHREMINASKAGKIFSKSEPTEISMVVSEVFQDKNNLGILGRKFAESHDWTVISKQMAEIFESV